MRIHKELFYKIVSQQFSFNDKPHFALHMVKAENRSE